LKKQAALEFAKCHDLCVAVFSTGHDFLNRHSCNGGVYIRTTLMKDKTVNLEDPRHADGGSITLGPGNVRTFKPSFLLYADYYFCINMLRVVTYTHMHTFACASSVYSYEHARV